LGAGFDLLMTKTTRLSLDYMGDFKQHIYNNAGALTLKWVF
jgi:hypothetical protein